MIRSLKLAHADVIVTCARYKYVRIWYINTYYYKPPGFIDSYNHFFLMIIVKYVYDLNSITAKRFGMEGKFT